MEGVATGEHVESLGEQPGFADLAASVGLDYNTPGKERGGGEGGGMEGREEGWRGEERWRGEKERDRGRGGMEEGEREEGWREERWRGGMEEGGREGRRARGRKDGGEKEERGRGRRAGEGGRMYVSTPDFSKLVPVSFPDRRLNGTKAPGLSSHQ